MIDSSNLLKSIEYKGIPGNVAAIPFTTCKGQFTVSKVLVPTLTCLTTKLFYMSQLHILTYSPLTLIYTWSFNDTFT